MGAPQRCTWQVLFDEFSSPDGIRELAGLRGIAHHEAGTLVFCRLRLPTRMYWDFGVFLWNIRSTQMLRSCIQTVFGRGVSITFVCQLHRQPAEPLTLLLPGILLPLLASLS